MKTMIAVPCMDHMDTDFVKSLLELEHVGEVRHDFISCSLVYKARNDLALRAKKREADYVLWLDSDMVFPETLMKDLMNDLTDGVDMVAGICHMRKPPFLPVLYKTLRQGMTPAENESETYDDYPKDGPFRVEGCGFGCVLMKRQVLDDVIFRYHEAFSPLPGFGEDLSFCVRARACGHDIWADPDIQVGHKACTVVTSSTFEAYRRAGVK